MMSAYEALRFYRWLKENHPNTVQDIHDRAKWRRKAPIALIREMEGNVLHTSWRAYERILG